MKRILSILLMCAILIPCLGAVIVSAEEEMIFSIGYQDKAVVDATQTFASMTTKGTPVYGEFESKKGTTPYVTFIDGTAVSGYMLSADEYSIAGMDEMSINVWARVKNSDAQSHLFTVSEGRLTNATMRCEVKDGVLTYYISNDIFASCNIQDYSDKWANYVFTKAWQEDKLTYALYIDGEKVIDESAETAFRPEDSASNFYIGMTGTHITQKNYTFNGDLAAFNIYNYVRAENDIIFDYNVASEQFEAPDDNTGDEPDKPEGAELLFDLAVSDSVEVGGKVAYDATGNYTDMWGNGAKKRTMNSLNGTTTYLEFNTEESSDRSGFAFGSDPAAYGSKAKKHIQGLKNVTYEVWLRGYDYLLTDRWNCLFESADHSMGVYIFGNSIQQSSFGSMSMSKYEGEWTLFDFVRQYNEDDGTQTVQIYVNGKKLSDKTEEFKEWTGTYMMIGNKNGQPISNDIRGDIGAFRIYDGARSEDEIASQYNEEQPSYCEALGWCTTQQNVEPDCETLKLKFISGVNVDNIQQSDISMQSEDGKAVGVEISDVDIKNNIIELQLLDYLSEGTVYTIHVDGISFNGVNGTVDAKLRTAENEISARILTRDAQGKLIQSLSGNNTVKLEVWTENKSEQTKSVSVVAVAYNSQGNIQTCSFETFSLSQGVNKTVYIPVSGLEEEGRICMFIMDVTNEAAFSVLNAPFVIK